jgi:hypothetical protein
MLKINQPKGERGVLTAEHAYRYSGSVKDNMQHWKGKDIFCDAIILEYEYVQDKVKTTYTRTLRSHTPRMRGDLSTSMWKM